MINLENIVNSKEYWDKRFTDDWEMNAGRKQTLFFCDITLNLMPSWLVEELEEGLTFADIGCAEGDCTNFLQQRFPNSEFTGLDFSEEAIAKATRHYPEVKYMAADVREMKNKYDLVYSSNTLEHFHNPLEILKYFFKNANKYVVILIPFQERIRFDEHFYTFEYRDFAMENSGFDLVYSREYDCSQIDNIFWAGKQLLLIYQKKDIVSGRTISLEDYVGELSEQYNISQEKLHQADLRIKSVDEDIKKLIDLSDNQAGLIQNQVELIKDQVNIISDISVSNSEHLKFIKEQAEIIKVKENEINHLQLNLLKEKKYKAKINVALISEKEKNKSLSDQEKWLFSENYKYAVELKKIKSSKFWKLATLYYNFRDQAPGVRHASKAIRYVNEHGVKNFIKALLHKIKKGGNSISVDAKQTAQLESTFTKLVEKYRNNDIDGIAIIPSAFPFDELYNQRTINLAKYLSQQKIACLFLVWQWEKAEVIDRSFEEVYPFVYSIPMYTLLDLPDSLSILHEVRSKQAYLNIPAEPYLDFIPFLRKYGFEVVYDIMDEWEEFHKVGQASWYNKDVEESFVIQADRVVTVSMPLVEKFTFLRNDVKCIGNGYYASLLGEKDISCKEANDQGNVYIGYFGHLTDSWFDWEMIFEIAEANKKFVFELIGYGASEEVLKKLKNYSNINYHGKVSPRELSVYVKKWHIGIIPFKESNLSYAVDPIKVYEYLYFGLQVVSTGIPHLKDYPNVIASSNNVSHFSESLIKAYNSAIGPYDSTELNIFLESTTWEERFHTMIDMQNSNCYVGLYKNE